MSSRPEKLFGNIDRVGETGTDRLDVEGHGTDVAQFSLQQASRAWENEVRRRRGNNDQIKFGGIYPGVLKRPATSLKSKFA